MRFGTWKVSGLCGADLLTAAAMELARYKLILVGIQEVRWKSGGTVRERNCNIFYGKGKENH